MTLASSNLVCRYHPAAIADRGDVVIRF